MLEIICENSRVISVQASASFSVLGIGSRALNMLEKRLTAELRPQPHSMFGTALLPGFDEHLSYVNPFGSEKAMH